MGSEGPICLAHWMDSPQPDDFNILVHSRWNLVTLSPFLLVMHDILALVMCFAGSNALMLGTVNSPGDPGYIPEAYHKAWKKGSVKGVVKVQLGLEKEKGV